MASRLEIYNNALLICGERFLADLTEDRLPRHLLDHVWDNDGVKKCLEAGQWKFAMRAVSVTYDPAIDPAFGYTRAFEKPDDWCATAGVCSDEYFKVPLLEYVEETSHWFADLDEIFVRYVSNDASFGGDLSKWPAKFEEYVSTYFASKIIMGLSKDDKKLNAILHPKSGLLAKALMSAKSLDAMSGPTTFPAEGNWTSSRRRGSSNRRDGGSRSNLTG